MAPHEIPPARGKRVGTSRSPSIPRSGVMRRASKIDPSTALIAGLEERVEKLEQEAVALSTAVFDALCPDVAYDYRAPGFPSWRSNKPPTADSQLWGIGVAIPGASGRVSSISISYAYRVDRDTSGTVTVEVPPGDFEYVETGSSPFPKPEADAQRFALMFRTRLGRRPELSFGVSTSLDGAKKIEVGIGAPGGDDLDLLHGLDVPLDAIRGADAFAVRLTGATWTDPKYGLVEFTPSEGDKPASLVVAGREQNPYLSAGKGADNSHVEL